jgi:hypothetical protein
MSPTLGVSDVGEIVMFCGQTTAVPLMVALLAQDRPPTDTEAAHVSENVPGDFTVTVCCVDTTDPLELYQL